MIVTTFQVKNMSSGPIARLTIEEFWYDKSRQPGHRATSSSSRSR